tara:strand:+ start:90 stop:1016 length:927 start_codon:yes stop_codon:yes gene_type:complete
MFFKKVPDPIHGRANHLIFSRCDSERSKFLEENHYTKKELENIQAKLEYNLLLLKMQIWEQRKIIALDEYKQLQLGVKKIWTAIEVCKEEISLNYDFGKKHAPFISGHTPATLKRSKLGPRTKFQKDCDWLNAELRRISSTGQVSPIDEIDGICQVSKFGAKKIISLSTDPMKLHAIWLAGWIQEAGFIGKEKNTEYQHFQERYRIPCIFTHNNKYELSPEWLVSFLLIQDKNSEQLKLIAEYFYKSQIDLDAWLSKICYMSWMSHNTYPITSEFPDPYFEILEETEEKAFKYLDAKWTKEQKKIDSQ